MVTAWFKRSSKFTILATIIGVALTLVLAVNAPAQVPAPSNSTPLSSKLENAFRAPQGPGAPTPDNREPAATRRATEYGGLRSARGCIEGNRPLVALVPTSEEIAQTATEYPTIFWYMPQTAALALEFVLRDKNVNDIYRVKYSLPKSTKGVVSTPDIKSLTMTNLYPLEIGQVYHWELSLICDPSDREKDVVVEGFIKRVQPAPTLASRLQQATPEDRIALYADAQLWYETLGALVELRRDRPNDRNLEDAWNTLLSSVGLEDVIAARPGN